MTVKQIQCLLTYLGYSPGTIDGIEGRNTQGAIRAFQADYGLTVDGIPGTSTQKMLIGAIAGTAVKVEKPEDSTAPKTGTFWDDIKYFTREEFRCSVQAAQCRGGRGIQLPAHHGTGCRPLRGYLPGEALCHSPGGTGRENPRAGRSGAVRMGYPRGQREIQPLERLRREYANGRS